MTAVATPPKATAAPRTPAPVGELRRIPLAELHESPFNRRTRYDQGTLDELAQSFLQTGQLTPIIVRPRKAGGYEIAAGHRRYRAAKIAVEKSPDGAKYRGVDALEAKVVILDDPAFIEVLNIENLQRDDLHPLEEAAGFKDLMTEAGYDVAKIAARVGRSTRYVYDSLTLLKLTPNAKKLFLAAAFERGHAILLARLTPEQQARAIGDVKEVAQGDRDSLLLEPDTSAEDQDELPLHDMVKPVSVREFQKAIQREIRATPEHVDPFLFPESAAALEAAKEEKLTVIHITREYLASDEVRQADQNQRVFGSQAWERADGAIDPYEDGFGDRPKHRSKTCDWSRYGFVASGPGQGEVFKVCINKQKCAVHWPEHVKRAEEAKKRAKKQTKAREAGPDAVAKEEARQAAEDAKREREDQHTQRVEDVVVRLIQERAPQWALGVVALGKQIKMPAQVASWMARSRALESDLEDVIKYGDVVRADTAFETMRPKLGGGWSKRGLPETAAAVPVAIALLFWLQNGFERVRIDAEHDAEKLVAAEEQAEAAKAKAAAAKKAEKKPAKKKAKKGKRA